MFLASLHAQLRLVGYLILTALKNKLAMSLEIALEQHLGKIATVIVTFLAMLSKVGLLFKVSHQSILMTVRL